MFEMLAILMYSLPNISKSYSVRPANNSMQRQLQNGIFQETFFPHLLPYLLPLIHIALTGSVYTTIAVAMERCVTVLAPFTQIRVS